MLAAEGTDRKTLGRAEFERRVWAWKAEYGGFITGQLRRLGASCDWSRERFTLDQQLSGAAVSEESPLTPVIPQMPPRDLGFQPPCGCARLCIP